MPKWNSKNRFLSWQTDASSRIPEVWELLDLFKEQCQLKMWKISKPEDWIKKTMTSIITFSASKQFILQSLKRFVQIVRLLFVKAFPIGL